MNPARIVAGSTEMCMNQNSKQLHPSIAQDRPRLQRVNRAAAALLILLSLTVSIPLMLKTIILHGGPWGFGMAGLGVLIPLSGYIVFAITPYLASETAQRKMFFSAQALTFAAGTICLMFLPFYPLIIVLVPMLLFGTSLVDRKRYRIYLLISMILAIAANLLFLVWEFDFDRTLPILQLFQPFQNDP